MILPQKFYNKPTLEVAQELIGKKLIRQTDKEKLTGRIIETEAYIGQKDKACHASKGKTKRTEVMFGPAGFWYIYLVYGMYYCLNIVTEENRFPAAVLIRALEPNEGILKMKQNRNKEKVKDLSSGPGKLCQALNINKSLNRKKSFNKSSSLWVEDDGYIVNNREIKTAKRIGVDYAGKYWANKKWRFYA